MRNGGVIRLFEYAVLAMAGSFFVGCVQLATDPTEGTVDDPVAAVEIATNPVTSDYYTEPTISYGYPGDGLADPNGDFGDTYLASYALKSGGNTPLVAAAVEHAAAMLSTTPGLIGTGTLRSIDGTSKVLLLAKDNATAAALPKIIDGVETDVHVTGIVRALDYTGTYRPVVPAGVSVGNSRENSSGTIGAIVVRHGIRYILSNNHVLARENSAVIGEPIVQPGRADSYGQPTGQIGVLSAYKKVSFTQNNVIDAAVARLTITNAYDEADQFAPTRSPIDAQANMYVKKVGRTTGISYGTITATDVTVKVDYDGRTATFANQIYIEGPFLKAGDSGSLLVNATSNDPVGLCFAGGDDGAFANPIAPVLNYFGVEIAGTSGN